MSMDPKTVAKRWRKEPKKFLERLIDDVWDIMDSDVYFINFSGYFKKVLWPYFNPGTSSTRHIVLIAKYAVYDSRIEDPIVSEGSLNYMLLSEKFSSYFKCLLAVARDSLNQKSNDGNIYPIYDLLAHFVSNCLHNLLVKRLILELFGLQIWRWLPDASKLIESAPVYIQSQFEKLEPSTEIPFMILLLGENKAKLLSDEQYSINAFLISCLHHSALRSRLNPVIKSLGYLSLVSKTVPNRDTLKYSIYYPVNDFTGENILDHEKIRANKFFEMQTKLYGVPEAQKLLLLPSIYDTLQEEVETILLSIDYQTLRQVHNIDLPKERIVIEIIDYLFTPLHDMNEVLSTYFDDVSKFSKPEKRFTSGNYLTKSDFLEIQLSGVKNKWICESIDHIRLVLERKFVKKMNSKYISQLSYGEEDPLKVHPTDHAFLSSNNVLESPVLLLQVLLPEKYSPIELTKVYGVYSMKVTTILSLDMKSKSMKLFTGDSKFNYIIKLPALHLDLNKIMKRDLILPPSVESIILLNLYDKKPLKLPTDLIRIDAGNSNLPKDYVYEDLRNETKRIKLDEVHTNSVRELVIDSKNKTYRYGAVSNNNWSLVDAHGLLSCLTNTITTITTAPHSDWIHCVVDNLIKNFPSERVLIVSPNPPIFASSNSVTLGSDVNSKLETLREEFDMSCEYISDLLKYLKIPEIETLTESGDILHSTLHGFIEPLWVQFLLGFKTNPTIDTLIRTFPFRNLSNSDFESIDLGIKVVRKIYTDIRLKYDALNQLSPLIKFAANEKEVENYFVSKLSSVVAISSNRLGDYLSLNLHKKIPFDTVILSDAHFMSEFESILPFYLSNPKRFIIMGCENINQKSLIHRISLIDNGKHLQRVDQKEQEDNERFNGGFDKTSQNITILQNKATISHNITEAEYMVSVYMYMRCIGYASEGVVLVVLGPIQKVLVEEMVQRKCGGTSFYGIPKVQSLNQTYGISNEYILLSTHGVTGVNLKCQITRAALSAKLGMYVFGNFQEKGSKLKIRVGEKYGSSRSKQSFLIEDEQHMADYVTQLESRRL